MTEGILSEISWEDIDHQIDQQLREAMQELHHEMDLKTEALRREMNMRTEAQNKTLMEGLADLLRAHGSPKCPRFGVDEASDSDLVSLEEDAHTNGRDEQLRPMEGDLLKKEFDESLIISNFSDISVGDNVVQKLCSGEDAQSIPSPILLEKNATEIELENSAELTATLVQENPDESPGGSELEDTSRDDDDDVWFDSPDKFASDFFLDSDGDDDVKIGDDDGDVVTFSPVSPTAVADAAFQPQTLGIDEFVDQQQSHSGAVQLFEERSKKTSSPFLGNSFEFNGVASLQTLAEAHLRTTSSADADDAPFEWTSSAGNPPVEELSIIPWDPGGRNMFDDMIIHKPWDKEVTGFQGGTDFTLYSLNHEMLTGDTDFQAVGNPRLMVTSGAIIPEISIQNDFQILRSWVENVTCVKGGGSLRELMKVMSNVIMKFWSNAFVAPIVAVCDFLGRTDENIARRDHMSSRNIVTWNCMIVGYVSRDFLKKAIDLLNQLEQGRFRHALMIYGCLDVVTTLRAQKGTEAALLADVEVSEGIYFHARIKNTFLSIRNSPLLSCALFMQACLRSQLGNFSDFKS